MERTVNPPPCLLCEGSTEAREALYCTECRVLLKMVEAKLDRVAGKLLDLIISKIAGLRGRVEALEWKEDLRNGSDT